MIPTPAHVAHYREQGYVHLPALVSPEQLDVLMVDLQGVLQKEQGTLATWRGPWREQFENGANFKLKVLNRLGTRSQTWREWLLSPEILEPVEALVGKPLKHVDAMLILKPPETGQAFPPHQDAAYYAADQPDYLIAALQLHATNTENGALRFLPGSHKNGLRPHNNTQGKAYMPEIDLADLVQVNAEPGDVICSNIFTVHGSLPNRSKGPRAIVRIGFQPR